VWGVYFFVSATLFWSEQLTNGSQNIPPEILPAVFGVLAILFFLFSIPWVKRFLFIRPIFKNLRERLPAISGTERQALEVGEVGFEKGFFLGRIDWQILRNIPTLTLTENEQEFLDGPVEMLCQMVDSWAIRHEHKRIPDNIWNFIFKNGFFGLRIPEEDGGLAFSFQAQSVIINKIASRSLDVATIVGVQNSLGPDELIKKYGTDEQKKYYLPRLVQGREIVSFAVTSPQGGTDVSSMNDIGYAAFGLHDGKKILGVRLTWNKRYITFAPKATLFVLAFRLLDPDNLLNSMEGTGITLALVPSNHSGVMSGRHVISGAVFPNGPTWGRDVFIPLEWIIGGRKGIGNGWRMIMESLFVGRAIALPSMSTAVTKAMLRYSTAYACVRRQFGQSIGTFEGVEEPIVRLIEASYLMESARTVTSAMIDQGERPISVASLMKYQTTEYARQAVNDAMDIYGGRGICDGPSNYLQAAYQMAPIGITVEGANIVTRSLITFAQGVLRAHPYMYAEMNSCKHPDEKQGLDAFESAISGHASLLISNSCRSFFHNMTGGVFGNAPKNVPHRVRRWYRQLWWASCNFACVADITATFLGGRIKKQQKIGGRLADALSELYFLSCVLKRYEDDGFLKDDYPIVELCVTNSLHRFKCAIRGVIENFPSVFMRRVLKVILLRFGKKWKLASDALGHTAASLVLKPGKVRDNLTRFTYISDSSDDPTTLLETAFRKSSKAKIAYQKVRNGIRDGILSRSSTGNVLLEEAKQKNVLTKEEIQDIQEAENIAERVIAVDHFGLKEQNIRHNGK